MSETSEAETCLASFRVGCKIARKRNRAANKYYSNRLYFLDSKEKKIYPSSLKNNCLFYFYGFGGYSDNYKMIFNDEPRFSKKLVAHPVDGSICGVTKSSTEDHVGPGSYLADQFEQRRSGWQRQSFSTRQPMTEPKNSMSRSDYYVSGVLSPNGTMATPASPARSKSPGPGYYEGPPSVFSFPTDTHRLQDLNLSSMSGANVQNFSTRPTTMASTPRFSFSNSTCLNKGVLFQSAANDNKTVGPGYYSVPRNDFIKRSYNIRARGPETGIRSANNTPISSPIAKPATQVRRVSTPRGSYRPTSAGNSPNPQSATMPARGSISSNGVSSQPSTPRSASANPSRPTSANTTPRGSSNNLRGPPPSSAVGASSTTPTKPTVLNGRGKGLFSEHGSLEKVNRASTTSVPQQQPSQQQQQASSSVTSIGKQRPI